MNPVEIEEAVSNLALEPFDAAVATYKVYGVQCRKLEALIHKVFAPALFDLTIPDRFGHDVKPREWFLVPISAIDEAVERIRDGSIVRFRYDPTSGRLVE